MGSKGTILVTGLNGYLAGWAVDAILKQGYNVRGTVRKMETGMKYQKAFNDLGYEGRVEAVQVPDIAQPGAFDEASRGCVAILHLASPVGVGVLSTDPVEIVGKAVGGTTTILDSAVKAGPQLQSVVLVSSAAAISDGEQKLHSDKDWSTKALATFAELGSKTDPLIAYAAAKTTAEKAFWEFREKQKPAFAMSAAQGTIFFGPARIPWESRDEIPLSLKLTIFDVMTGGDPSDPMLYFKDTIDVRDMARVVVWAALNPKEADGERYLCSSATGCRQAVADIFSKHMPELPVQKGEPGRGYEPDYGPSKTGPTWDASKTVRATGRDWTPYEKSVLDSARFLQRYMDE